MSILISCPKCKCKLRVADELRSKSVKCSSCGTIFTATATAGMGTESSPPSRQDAVQPGSSPSSPPPGQYQEALNAARREPAASRADDPRREANDEDSGRRPVGRSGNAGAATSVKPPAICLLVLSTLFLLAFPIYMIVQIIVAANAKGAASDEAIGRVAIQGCFGSVIFLVNIFILIGALMMLKMRAYGLAMTASIMAMIPCLTFFCLGIPFGIWGLVVLMKPEVKEAFH